MIQTTIRRAALGILGAALVLAASPAARADGESGNSGSVGSWVRVSLDVEDPFVSTADMPDAALLKFHVFGQGENPMRGIDYGLMIEGGTFLSYAVATDRPWLALPIVDGYPESIGQAIVGDDCLASPVLIGTLLVEPDEPGGVVRVAAVQSEWSLAAYMLNCKNEPMYSFVSYGACVNGRPSPPRVIRGDETIGQHKENFPGAEEQDAAPSDGASDD